MGHSFYQNEKNKTQWNKWLFLSHRHLLCLFWTPFPRSTCIKNNMADKLPRCRSPDYWLVAGRSDQLTLSNTCERSKKTLCLVSALWSISLPTPCLLLASLILCLFVFMVFKFTVYAQNIVIYCTTETRNAFFPRVVLCMLTQPPYIKPLPFCWIKYPFKGAPLTMQLHYTMKAGILFVFVSCDICVRVDVEQYTQ